MTLQEARAGIDTVDVELSRLIEERARLAYIAARVRGSRERDPAREAAVVASAEARAVLASAAAVRSVFEAVMAACREAQ